MFYVNKLILVTHMLDNLPLEIIALVLGYVNKSSILVAGLTCKRWNVLIRCMNVEYSVESTEFINDAASHGHVSHILIPRVAVLTGNAGLLAIQYNHYDVFKEVYNLINTERLTKDWLDCAMEFGRLEIYNWLTTLNETRNTDDSTIRSYFIAVKVGHLHMIPIISHELNESMMFNALMVAAAHGSFGIFAMMLVYYDEKYTTRACVLQSARRIAALFGNCEFLEIDGRESVVKEAVAGCTTKSLEWVESNEPADVWKDPALYYIALQGWMVNRVDCNRQEKDTELFGYGRVLISGTTVQKLATLDWLFDRGCPLPHMIPTGIGYPAFDSELTDWIISHDG